MKNNAESGIALILTFNLNFMSKSVYDFRNHIKSHPSGFIFSIMIIASSEPLFKNSSDIAVFHSLSMVFYKKLYGLCLLCCP